MPLRSKTSTIVRLGSGALLALGLAALQGCGGSGSSSGTPTTITNLAGAWKATNTDGSPIYALIVPASGGSSSTFTYRTIETTPASGGVNQLFGSDLTLASSGGAVTSQNASAIFAASTAGGAQAFTGGSISGTANSSGMPLTFTPTPPSSYPTLGETFTPDTAANQLQITPASLAGQYTATAGNTSVGTATTLNVTVAANGSLQFVDTANQVNGSAIQIGTSNAFTVNATLNGNAAGFSGLAYAVPGAAANTYNLIVMTSNASNQSLAGIFTYQGPLPLTTLAGAYQLSDDHGNRYGWLLITPPTSATGTYGLRGLGMDTSKQPPVVFQVTGPLSFTSGSTSLGGSNFFYLEPPATVQGPSTITGTADTSGLNFTIGGTIGAEDATLDYASTFASLNAANLAGTYSSPAGSNSSGQQVTINVVNATSSAASLITLTFSDTTGALTLGQATQVGPGLNAFNVTASFSGTSFSGTGYAIPVPGTGKYTLVVMLDNATATSHPTLSLAGIFNQQ